MFSVYLLIICVVVIVINSGFRTDKNYPQAFLEECKYVVEDMYF